MKTVLLTTIFCSIFCFGKAQISFEKTFGGNYNDEGIASFPSTGGTIIIAGNTKSFGAGAGDIYLLKLNAQGDTLWTRTYGGENDDVAMAVQQTADGGFIIAGYSNSFSASQDAYTIRTDANGSVVWSKTFGGSGDDAAYNVKETSTGGFIIAGYTQSAGAGGKDVYLLSLDPEGNADWSKTYGSSDDEQANSVALTADGGYFITGTAIVDGNPDVYIVKTDSSGTKVWSETIGGAAAEEGKSGIQTTDGSYVITGNSNSFGHGSNDIYLIKTDAAGTLVFSKTFSTEGADAGNEVKEVTGGYLIAGSITNAQGNTDACIIGTDTAGTMLMARSFGDIGDESANDVFVTSAGGYVITGTAGIVAGSPDVYLVKTNTDGITTCSEKMTMVTEADVISVVSTVADNTAPMPAAVLYNPIVSIHSGCVSVTRCYINAGVLNTDTLASFLPMKLDVENATPRSVTTTAASAIVFYPNPTTGQFNISGLQPGTKMEIFDVTGKLVYQSVCNNELESIDITKEAKGLYFYRITGADVLLKSGKIVKE